MTEYKINKNKLMELVKKSNYTLEDLKQRSLNYGELARLLDCTPYDFLEEVKKEAPKFEGIVTTYEGKTEYFRSWEWYSEERQDLTRAQVLRDLKGNGYKVSFIVTSDKMRIIEQLCDYFEERTNFVVRNYSMLMNALKDLGYTYIVVDGYAERVKIK